MTGTTTRALKQRLAKLEDRLMHPTDDHTRQALVSAARMLTKDDTVVSLHPTIADLAEAIERLCDKLDASTAAINAKLDRVHPRPEVPSQPASAMCRPEGEHVHAYDSQQIVGTYDPAEHDKLLARLKAARDDVVLT